MQIEDLAINADASERTNQASGTGKVLALYPTINRLNSGWASGIQEPTDKKVSSSWSSQESCQNAQRKIQKHGTDVQRSEKAGGRNGDEEQQKNADKEDIKAEKTRTVK